VLEIYAKLGTLSCCWIWCGIASSDVK